MPITDLARLDAIYGAPVPLSLTKVQTRITPAYRRWIDAARLEPVAVKRSADGVACMARAIKPATDGV